MLRAVLSWEDSRRVVSVGSCLYVGKQFPSPHDERHGGGEFAVLSIGAQEALEEWQPGFYRLDVNLMELNDVLLKLTK